jgi:5'-3' exonuclease
MLFDLNSVSKKNASKYIKYYNFTTKSNVYYTCPNPRYPNFSFLIGIHTQDYCVPCCKKKGNQDPKVYSGCLKDHLYADVDKLTKKSRYIINYGKSIEYRRLSHLPDAIKSYFLQYARVISDNFLPTHFIYNDSIVPVDKYSYMKPKMIKFDKLKKYIRKITKYGRQYWRYTRNSGIESIRVQFDKESIITTFNRFKTWRRLSTTVASDNVG